MKSLVSLTACLGMVLAVGCGQNAPTATTPPGAASPDDGSRYLLKEEPQGAAGVIQVREAAGNGDDVLIVGRIGGSANPWIESRAAFSIVDTSLKACSDVPGDECPKPWDYCCETDKLARSTALVKVVDEDGELVQADARALLDVKELSTVVVKGKAERDEAGNLTVIASAVYVKK